MGAQISAKEALWINISSGDTQSQQLFDYSSEKLVEQKNILDFPSYISYKGDQLNYSKNIQQNTIFQITMPSYNQININNLKNTSEQSTIWKVIRQDQRHLLNKGDFIKIGKVKIRVKEFISSPTINNSVDLNETYHSKSVVSEQLQMSMSMVSKDQQCRVCFDSKNTQRNPLISLCKCSGSVKFIHFKCLKDWTSNSITRKQYPQYYHYTYIQNHCQLCKETISNEFVHQGKKYTLFNFDKIKQAHVILQGREIENGKSKISLFMIKLTEGVQMVVGRNNIAQIMMKDISISRTHCSLTLIKNQLFIADKKSKFGTLLNLKSSEEFSISQGISLQFQSKLIQISQTRQIRNCCCSQIDSFNLVYRAESNII